MAGRELSDPPEPTSDVITFSTDAVRAAGDADLLQGFTLAVISGPDANTRFASSGALMTVGTHSSASAVLHDQTVSRFHCEIAIEGERARIRDLGSLNGTMVDSVAIVEGFLRSGSTISIGRTRLRFDVVGDHIRVPASEGDRFALLIGRSVAMRRAFAVMARAAASDATVLIEGETGTGKEAAAESLHREGARRDKPFMVVDCASIPHNLLESELFGHEKGSFTGASGARVGVFEAADGGTVFLDEIGELGPDLQPKLLRVLERKQIRRIGANKYVPVDVRVIAATNRDLRTEVNARRFRSDLYYRLAVVEVRLPALRERREDLPLLVEHFLGTLAANGPAADVVRSQSFLTGLEQHQWPGNVRELRNYIERTLTLHEAEPLDRASSSAPEARADVGRPLKVAREEWLSRFERIYLEEILARHEGNVTAAARAAGVDRVHFYRLLWKHQLR
jgi:two-component system response regulator GlrR